ncbi:MAG TPA: hypothetical protein VHA15_15830 [Burkholderiales bacterium]|jgi:hypothetical protein|nr:hypothetical protein [Burkholderiales bacterium]
MLTSIRLLGATILVAAASAAPAQDPKPAPITVLKDASPVMYGRSAKVKAVVEAMDVASRHVTIKGPRGRPVTMRVEARVRNLADIAVGDEVTVRFHESVGLEVRKAEEGESLPAKEIVMQDEAPGNAAAGPVRLSVIASVESAGVREKTLVLKDDEGRFYDLYVRDEKLLASLKPGDRVFASYTEAAVVSIDGPRDKDDKDPKSKRKPRRK